MRLVARHIEFADTHREIDRVDIFECRREPVEMRGEEQERERDDSRDREMR